MHRVRYVLPPTHLRLKRAQKPSDGQPSPIVCMTEYRIFEADQTLSARVKAFGTTRIWLCLPLGALFEYSLVRRVERSPNHAI